MTDPVMSSRDGPILTLTLNLPDRRNPISEPAVIDALEEALEVADADLAIRAVILTGAGNAFSSGGNIKQMVVGGGLRDQVVARTRSNYRKGIQRLPRLFQKLEVPVIAAINGPAIGAGCDLACMCDIRIAGKNAKFAGSFVKLGLIPGDGGAWLLPRIVGFSKACELLLTGDTLNAEQALSCGLVSSVVDDQILIEEATRLARRIAVNSPIAVRMTKRLLWDGRSASLEAVLEMSAAMQSLVHDTTEHSKVLEAFLWNNIGI